MLPLKASVFSPVDKEIDIYTLYGCFWDKNEIADPAYIKNIRSELFSLPPPPRGNKENYLWANKMN